MHTDVKRQSFSEYRALDLEEEVFASAMRENFAAAGVNRSYNWKNFLGWLKLIN
jgi:hypothetical protein